jgi:hypothetical protein
LKIFISSVQKEFAELRRDLKSFLLGDAVLHRFVAEVFLFEELPAKDRRADEIYLEEVERSDIYLGIFGYEYGYEDDNGASPTEHEYDHATRLKRTRLIYVWGTDEKKRAPKMRKLVSRASGQLIRRRVENVSALTAEVYAPVWWIIWTARARSACRRSTLRRATAPHWQTSPANGSSGFYRPPAASAAFP